MPEPVVLLVDDPRTRDLVEAELRKRYEADYEVISTGSATEALDVLGQVRDRGSQLSLVLAAEWLPGAAGTELLARVRQLHPAARRVLVTAWGYQASWEPILQSLAVGDIDAYVARPMTVPDERFHRVITEQLDEWGRSNLPGFEAVRVVGEASAARSHEFRELLGRNGVPFGFYPADSPEGQRLLQDAGAAAQALPAVVMFDGRVLSNPSNAEVGDAIGVQIKPGGGPYDVTVIGAGPALRRRSTAPRRACPPSFWNRKRSAARPGPAH